MSGRLRFQCPMQNYKGARRAFQNCISVIPDFSKAWVSWAQASPPSDFEGNVSQFLSGQLGNEASSIRIATI